MFLNFVLADFLARRSPGEGGSACQMKKVFLFLFIFGLVIFSLRFLTPEDTWVKDKYGNWVKHGNPKSPKPTSLLSPLSPPSPSKPRVNREELLGFCGVSSYGKCDYDTDCYISGCNGEICQSKNEQPILSACVVLDCHKKPEGIVCGCQKGECQWQKK